MLLRSMQMHEELADAKAENDALRDDVAAGRHRLPHQSSLAWSVREACNTPAWIIQPPRLADTFERDYFTLRRLILPMQKQLKEPEYINEQCR